MLITLTFVLIISLLISSYTLKNNKMLTFLILALMGVLFFGNYENPDFYNYKIAYNNIENLGNGYQHFVTSFAYNYYQYILNKLGLQYEQTLIITFLVGFSLLFTTIKKYTQDLNFVFLLYFIYPFFLDIVQIRNFLAMSIFIFSIRYLIDHSISGMIKYFFLILLSASFQNVAIIYLIFIFIPKYINKKIKYLIFFSIALLIIISYTSDFLQILISNIFILIDLPETKEFYLTTKTYLGFILFSSYQILSYLLIRISLKIYIRNNENYKNQKSFLFLNNIYNINIIAFLFIPLYTFNIAFLRVFRNLVLLNYISYSIVRNTFDKRYSIKRLKYDFLTIFYVIYLFIFEILINRFDYVVIPIYTNNLFFN